MYTGTALLSLLESWTETSNELRFQPALNILYCVDLYLGVVDDAKQAVYDRGVQYLKSDLAMLQSQASLTSEFIQKFHLNAQQQALDLADLST